jgi:hypothetical protein
MMSIAIRLILALILLPVPHALSPALGLHCPYPREP